MPSYPACRKFLNRCCSCFMFGFCSLIPSGNFPVLRMLSTCSGGDQLFKLGKAFFLTIQSTDDAITYFHVRKQLLRSKLTCKLSQEKHIMIVEWHPSILYFLSYFYFKLFYWIFWVNFIFFKPLKVSFIPLVPFTRWNFTCNC